MLKSRLVLFSVHHSFWCLFDLLNTVCVTLYHISLLGIIKKHKSVLLQDMSLKNHHPPDKDTDKDTSMEQPSSPRHRKVRVVLLLYM